MIDSNCRIGLVHLTDIHWEFADGALIDSSLGYEKIDVELHFRHEAYLKQILQELRKCSEECGIVILVLGGDNFYRGDFSMEKVACMNRYLLTPLLDMKKNDGKSNLISAVFAVPGNHDIINIHKAKAGSKAKAASPGSGTGNTVNPADIRFDKFQSFKEWVSQLRVIAANNGVSIYSPFDIETVVRIPVGGFKPVAFWLANSSSACAYLDTTEQTFLRFKESLKSAVDNLPGDFNEIARALESFFPQQGESLNSYDPGYVEAMDMLRCQDELGHSDDLIRIAVFHHNNLPTTNDDRLKYRFLNASAFNDFLLKNNFRVALHGHQHIGEIASYSKFEPSVGSPYNTYLEGGFITISSPAFDIQEHNTTHCGFNVIRLEIGPDSDVCGVQVDRLLWNSISRSFGRESTHNDIAVKTLDDPDRLRCLRDVNRIIFSSKPIRGIARGIDSLDESCYRTDHSTGLRLKLRNFQHVRASYVMSVFNPGFWLGSKMLEFLLPLGRINIATAAFNASGRRRKGSNVSNSLLFRFSKPLMFGIRTATTNAELTKTIAFHNIVKKFRSNGYHQAGDFATARLRRFEKSVQMSRFGDAYKVYTGGFSARHEDSHEIILAGDGPERPYAQFSGTHRKEARAVAGLSEHTRIVLWNYEDFRKPSALDIIEMHENLCFPLLWIDPSLLVSREGNARKRIGYWSIIRYDERRRHHKQIAQEFFHEESGRAVTGTEIFVPTVWGTEAASLWPLKKQEMGLDESHFNHLLSDSKALHEFIWMLGHPSICFAADAWMMSYAGFDHFKQYRYHLKQIFDVHISK